jgi:CsoR family transcriptional regulator, copper-sensing transcriptional repressor
MQDDREEFESSEGVPGPRESGEPFHIHEHQQSVVSRLARIEGHVRGVKRMVEQGQPCPDILVQIAALRSALNGVGRIILEDHLKECMVRAVRQGDFQAEYEALARSLDLFIR